MGAAAVRGHTHTTTFTFSPSGYTTNISPNVNFPPPPQEIMTCEACQTSFTFFKKKKICRDCGRHFCSECVHRYRDPDNNRKSFRQCKTCKVLTSGKFTRQELLKWKVKDLRFLLNKRNVSTDTCTEKQDLIDLLFVTFARVQDQGGSEQAEEESISRQASSLSGSTINSASETSPSDQTPQSNFSPPADPVPQSEDLRSDRLRQRQEQEMREALLRHSIFEEETPQDQQAPAKVRMKIGDIASPEDVENLTVRQLKEVLVVNFVDYKGCVEKKELVERVKRLWNEHKNNQDKAKEITRVADDPNAAPMDKNPEDDLCKICMDAAIDCVLLECGHMVSCTKCGKRLNECPICRQFVVRVVHTFKS